MVKFSDENVEKMFGAEDAENENPQRLKEYFFRNKAYESLKSDLPIRILVGHKGVGKSALLKIAFLEDKDSKVLSLWLQPDAVSRAYDKEASNFNALIESWKIGLTNLILQKIIEEIIPSWQPAAPLKGTLTALMGAVKDAFDKNHLIDKSVQPLIEKYRETRTIRVYLDDLDRGWEAKPSDIKNISALLNAMRDLCGDKSNLQFRLGLRSDVYYLVRTSDESTDKIERHRIPLTWDNHEILTLLVKRVENFFGRSMDEQLLLQQPQGQLAKFLEPIIESRFAGAGKWHNVPIHRVLLSMTRRRPRDLIKLFYSAAKEAYRNDHAKISTSDLRSVFEAYSSERLQDIINEFRSELPDVGNLVHAMRPTTREKRTMENYFYTNDELINKLKNIISQNTFRFTNGRPVTPRSLAEFLYKIDFVTARKDGDDGEIIRKYFDQNQYLQNQFVDYGFSWEVHPAYRWALQPGDMNSIFAKLDLEPDVDRVKR